MTIREISRDDLQNLHAQTPRAQFLQSWEWGEVLRARGRSVVRVGVHDDAGRLVLAVTLSTEPERFGRAFLYCPRGPVFASDADADARVRAIGALADHLSRTAGSSVVAWRLEPVMRDIPTGKRVSPVQPKRTFMTSLEGGMENVLAGMHQKTRYNIRLAEKKGVTVDMRTDNEAVDIFWKLLKQTAKRDRFHSHPKSFYDAILSVLGKNDPADRTAASARLYVASLGEKLIAATLVTFYLDTATYLHGASSNADRNTMAPYLAQWAAMQDAMRWGYAWYDFHGIADTDSKRHPWAGITRFKKGFGGEIVEYPGTFDIVLNHPWYTLLTVARTVWRVVKP